MCGIVGYIGQKDTDLFQILKNGLIGLEYRGYDSAGLAYIDGTDFEVVKCVGGPGNLQALSEKRSAVGIGHTRWATHGGISEENSHPHLDCERSVAVVHNGTIENFAELTTYLKKQGHTFSSSTDTEVLAHLIEREHTQLPLKEAVEEALSHIVGAFGVAVMSIKEPRNIIAARRGSPLLIGIGQDALMVASDKNALVEYCNHVVYLDDNELVEITADGFKVAAIGGAEVKKRKHKIDIAEADSGKGRYKHFMIKEIEEQQHTLPAGLAGRIDIEKGLPVLGGLKQIQTKLKKINHIILTGCGTASYAAQYAKYLFGQILDIPVRVEVASELMYEKINEPSDETLAIFVSQSGETADTKDVLIEMKQKGFLCLGIVNVAGSSIAREAGVGVYVRAGIERAVASTKAFTSQVLALILLGITMARQRGMSKIEAQTILTELDSMTKHYGKLMTKLKPVMKRWAKQLHKSKNIYFLGKKYSYAVALEGALKVEEITYIPTESFPAGEIKHGPLALVDKNFVSIIIAPEANLFDKVGNTVHEIKARGGTVFLITSEKLKKHKLTKFVDEVLFIPEVKFNFLYPLYTALPLQLLSYEIALLLDREIDKPRNLAKSVTVQ